MKKTLVGLAFLFTIHFLHAQDFSLYQKKVFIRGVDSIQYRILYPADYTSDRSWPLVIFLHGAGERGSDNEAQLLHGGDYFLTDSIRKKFPAIVIFPQCPADSFWSRFPSGKRDTSANAYKLLNRFACTKPELLVKLLADSLVSNGIADKKKIYLGGLSLGGFGTYDLVIHYPDFFAAAFPICGQVNVDLYVKKALPLPLWFFHGSADNVVDPDPDRKLYRALKAADAKKVHYTEYPNVGHNSWDNAFAEPGLMPWIFSNHK